MIKLKNILNEVLNTFSVQAFMLTDSNFNITDILEQIRAIRKITIVRNITPPEYIQKKNIEYTLVNIKFVTRGDAKRDLEKIKQDVLTSDRSATDLRVPGVKSFKYKEGSLRRL